MRHVGFTLTSAALLCSASEVAAGGGTLVSAEESFDGLALFRAKSYRQIDGRIWIVELAQPAEALVTTTPAGVEVLRGQHYVAAYFHPTGQRFPMGRLLRPFVAPFEKCGRHLAPDFPDREMFCARTPVMLWVTSAQVIPHCDGREQFCRELAAGLWSDSHVERKTVIDKLFGEVTMTGQEPQIVEWAHGALSSLYWSAWISGDALGSDQAFGWRIQELALSDRVPLDWRLEYLVILFRIAPGRMLLPVVMRAEPAVALEAAGYFCNARDRAAAAEILPRLAQLQSEGARQLETCFRALLPQR